MQKRNFLVGALVLTGLAAYWFLSNRKKVDSVRFSPEKIARIVLFGDGLVSGNNEDISGGYFKYLQGKLPGVELVAAGQNGATTADGMDRLGHDVLALAPQAVVITLGMEDLRQGMSLEKTLGNLEKIFDQLHQQKIMVLYAGAALPATGDNWLMSLSQLCQQKGVLFLDGLLNPVWENPDMHDAEKSFPEDPGFQYIADRVYEALSAYL